MAAGPRIDYKVIAQPYTVDENELIDVLNPTATTDQLDDEAYHLNTKDKFTGRCVFDTTLGRPVWADGGGINDTWSLSTGVVSSTPAP